MTADDLLTLHPDILFRKVDDEGIIVDQRQPEVMVINSQALRILELIRETGSRQELLTRLSAEYETNPATLAADVDEFLLQLRERDMLI
jgi:signal transduction histidine kinase